MLIASMTCVLATAVVAYGQHHHEGDFVIGVSGGAAPQLKFEFDEHLLAGDETIPLVPSVNPAVPGWLSSAPGFEALEADEAEEDFFRLGPGVQIRLVGLDLEPALFVRAATLGTPVRIGPSPALGHLELGGDALHTHGVWHINSSDPGFDPQQAVWAGTFKFVDAGTTGYGDSEPFTLRFAVVPEPASIAILSIGLLYIARRNGR